MLAAAALGAAAPPAHAGSYSVFACGSYDNRSWNSVARQPASAPTRRCPGSSSMGNTVGGGERVPLGAAGTTTFTAPAGMSIADFMLTRQLTYRNGTPAQGTRPLYAIYKLGSTVFAGAGRYENATRSRLNAVGSWYGYPENNVVVPRSTVRRSSFPALAGYAGTATTLQIAVGCFNGSVDTACTVAPGGGIAHLLSGAQVVLNDPTAARRVDRGLGPARRRRALRLRRRHARRHRQRRHPARRDPRPHRGRRRASSAQEDYAAGSRTDTGATCSFRLAQGLPEPQERDRPPDPPGRRPADPEGPDHRRRRQRDRAGPLRGQRRHAVGPRRRSTAPARPRTAS